MSSISKPNTFSSGTTISSSEVNDNFDTIYNDYNGGISSANLANGAVTTAKIADGAVTTAKLASDLIDTGWLSLTGTHSVSTGYNAGNRSFTIATSTDHTATLSEGMRYKVTRSTTPSTQCADLESGSSQYASKSSPTGITFTDDFTCEAWVKLESYTGTQQTIIGRFNTTSGWLFQVRDDGTVRISGFNAGGGNISYANTYQSIPLGRWVHVAAKLDMSGFTYGESNSQIYIDGVAVPGTVARGGTNPTALVQAGDLQVGAYNGATTPFDGKISEARIWSDARTTTEIQDNMYKSLTGAESNLVGYWKLAGDFTDETNNNDLTAQNSATADAIDNPFNATEYGIITSVSASEIQLFCPIGYGIPNETLSNPFYSTQDTPYGFPRDKGLWQVESIYKSSATAGSTSAGNYTFGDNQGQLTVPIGTWKLQAVAPLSAESVSSTDVYAAMTVSSSSSTVAIGSEEDVQMSHFIDTQVVNHAARSMVLREKYLNLTTPTTYYRLVGKQNNNISSIVFSNTIGASYLRVESAYI